MKWCVGVMEMGVESDRWGMECIEEVGGCMKDLKNFLNRGDGGILGCGK